MEGKKRVMEMLRSVLLTNRKSPRPGLCYVLTPSLILVGEGKDRNPDPARSGRLVAEILV